MKIMGMILIMAVAAIYWLDNVLDVRHYLNFIIVILLGLTFVSKFLIDLTIFYALSQTFIH